MAKYALIKNGVIENAIEWDGVTPYTPPNGCEIMLFETAVADENIDNSAFLPPDSETSPQKPI